MTPRMRNKARLLSRVSTIAVLAAAGSFGVVQQAAADCTTTFNVNDGARTVNTNSTCADVTTDVNGNVLNTAVIGAPGTSYIAFDVRNDIFGSFTNNTNIFNTSTNTGALTIHQGATITNGLFNNGLISNAGDALQIGTGGEGDDGNIFGGITNTNAITSGGGNAIAALQGTLTGGLVNQFDTQASVISGGLAGVYIGDLFDSWSGGVTNQGQITGTDNGGIVMGDGGGNGSIEFSGGIWNATNAQIESQNGAGIRITNDVNTFGGGIQNNGVISGSSNGIYIEAGTFSGGLNNTSSITASSNIGVGVYANTIWNGEFNNSGNIEAAGNLGNGFFFEGKSFTGNFTNSNTIVGGEGGVTFNNSDLIINAGLGGEGQPITAEFVNTGVISGDTRGFFIRANTVDANFSNAQSEVPFSAPPLISATSGAALTLSADVWRGNITNEGSITGVAGAVIGGTATFVEGMDVFSQGGSFAGDINNSGVISGYSAGLYVTGLSFDGDVTNSGRISSVTGSAASFIGDSGFSLLLPVFAEGTFTGTITNTGSMIGGDRGLTVSYDQFTGDIINASTGYIVGGDTGALINIGTMTGDVINNGVIIGNSVDTGLHIQANIFNGDVINNNSITAASDALVVEIGDMDGIVTNNGVLRSTNDGRAVLLDIDDASATFLNTGEIFGDVALSDIVFGTKTAYTFRGEQGGGLVGNITGQPDTGGEGSPNNDFIVVQNGSHYFEAESLDAVYGPQDGTASNFASFTVDNGGTAIMGAHELGDTDGAGYLFANVDALNVTNGTLYIDKSTTLQVDNNYTQTANGTLAFFLAAPGGEGFSELTGDVEADPNTDYGQVIAGGTANLGNGVIAAYLDPEFAHANPELTQVAYRDAIVAGNPITTEFSSSEVFSVDSIFLLNYEVNGEGSSAGNNTVDLFVQRVDLSHLGNVNSIVVNTGELFDANTTNGGQGVSGCGIAGPGWCYNRYAQAGSSVMTDATPGEDPFVWLRAGARAVGETSFWGRAVGVWGETDGDVGIAASDFDTFGGIVGVDHVFTQTLLAGVAAQFTSQDIEFEGIADNAEVDSVEVGAYASFGDARLYANANVSFIWHDFATHRFVGPNVANGDYDGTTFSAYLEGGKTFETDGGLRINPMLGVSYANLDTDPYTETGSALILFNVNDSEFESIRGMAGLRFMYPIALGSGRRLIPEVRAIYQHEFGDDQSVITNQFGTIFGEEYSRETVVLGAGLTAPLSDATSFAIDYDASLNEDITTHTLSAGLRARW